MDLKSADGSTILTMTGPRFFDTKTRAHFVPDRTVVTGLRGDLDSECGHFWYACVILQHGRGSLQPAHHRVKEPTEAMRQFLMGLALALNKELHYTGHWVTAMTEPREIICMWRDGDGDVQVTMNISRRSFEEIERDGIPAFLQQADQSIKEWAEQMKLLELSEKQQFKQVLGEKPPTN